MSFFFFLSAPRSEKSLPIPDMDIIFFVVVLLHLHSMWLQQPNATVRTHKSNKKFNERTYFEYETMDSFE